MKQSIMWQYIAEQPAVLRPLLQAPRIAKIARSIGADILAIYFVCHGSSYNAAMVALDFIARQAGLRCYAMTPANFLYNTATLTQENRSNTLVVTISQTGTSRGCIEALHHATTLGFCTLAITDIVTSPLACKATHLLEIGCGVEDSNAKTKGYSATVLLLLLLGIELGRLRGKLSDPCCDQLRQELTQAVDSIKSSTARIVRWCQEQQFGTAMQDIYLLGYGMNFGTALEGQLKLMETMCIPTMFNDLEEFSHGMHRAITKNSTVLLLKTEHPLAALAESTFAYLRSKCDHVYLLDATATPQEGPGRLLIPYLPQTQSVLPLTLAIQIFSVFAPEYNNRDPNADANNDYTDYVHTRI